MLDLIIVGAGPAGLSAALTASCFKMRTLIIEAGQAGGQLVSMYPWKEVYNYLGFYKKTGIDVVRAMVEHVKAEGVKIHENETVTDIVRHSNPDYYAVKTTMAEYKCTAIIIAMGMGAPNKLGVHGEELNGVLYSIIDPQAFKGKRLVVVGGGNTAVESALVSMQHGADVLLVHRREELRATDNFKEEAKKKLKILWNTEVRKILGNGRGAVGGILVENNKTGKRDTLQCDFVLLALGSSPPIDFFRKVGIKTDENGLVIVDSEMRTNLCGIFAAGDACRKWKRIPHAVGDGSIAAYSAYAFVKKPYWC
ncbi:MAG: FAD-dependent oxidoreductase [Candidatus Micrarchaeia archaeon]